MTILLSINDLLLFYLPSVFLSFRVRGDSRPLRMNL